MKPTKAALTGAIAAGVGFMASLLLIAVSPVYPPIFGLIAKIGAALSILLIVGNLFVYGLIITYKPENNGEQK